MIKNKLKLSLVTAIAITGLNTTAIANPTADATDDNIIYLAIRTYSIKLSRERLT